MKTLLSIFLWVVAYLVAIRVLSTVTDGGIGPLELLVVFLVMAGSWILWRKRSRR
ncbi:MAG: hypothetical protein JWQ74_87 [Marmoricola sp.]|nr:hypothetical protein [Marmoricola sp.]